MWHVSDHPRQQPRRLGQWSDRRPAQRARDISVQWLSRHRHHPVSRMGVSAAGAFIRASHNYSFNIERNGEAWLLATLRPAVVIDVGANVGDYAAEVLRASPTASVWCFEVVPSTAESCRRRFAGDPRVAVRAVGLSDHAGDVDVRFYPDQQRLSSLTARHDLRYELVQGRVERGDEQFDHEAGDRVDLLKIDAEGVDYEVLLGFEKMLAGGRVAVVQFEYGPLCAETKHLLRDYVEFLGDFGFEVGKLYPESVDFRPYDVWRDEDFRGPNHVAVLKSSGLRPMLEHPRR
jgi:FkbM family methyltransferase